MKLLCIKDSSDQAHTRNGIITVPEKLRVRCGNIYTVKQEVIGYKGERKWQLVEKPAHCRYNKEYFTEIYHNESLKEGEFEIEIVKS